jgi:FixJ family two-component response regulator
MAASGTMQSSIRTSIFVVDDDPTFLEVVSLVLESGGFDCRCFNSADECLPHLSPQSCILLITDVRMPGKDGLELLDDVKRAIPWLPVIVVTSYGDIPMAVEAVKTGAFDFIQKPLDPETFLTKVGSALQQDALADILRGKPLTKTQTTVLQLILQGRTNVDIANMLGRSVRTIEVHRSHIMHKLKADNVVDLVKKAMDLGFGDTK